MDVRWTLKTRFVPAGLFHFLYIFLLVGSSRDGTGIMFLNEVALGKQHIIHQDDSSLVAAPKGFDSVLAQGGREPGNLP